MVEQRVDGRQRCQAVDREIEGHGRDDPEQNGPATALRDQSAPGRAADETTGDVPFAGSTDGELLASVPTQQEDPPTFAFAAGTDTLYYEDGDGVVRRFAIDVDQAAQLARSVLTRGFTPQECARYFPDEPCPTFEV
jgi:hypothetical protein